MKHYIWTENNTQILETFVREGKTAQDVLAKIQTSSLGGVRRKAHELGLKFQSGLRKRWSDSDKNLLKELNDTGHDHAALARRFNVSINSIESVCSELGLKSKNVFIWTPELERRLQVLFHKGERLSDIATKLNVSYSSAAKKAKTLNLSSQKSRLMTEQGNLKRQGLRRCAICKGVFPYSQEYFYGSHRCCKKCDCLSANERYAKRREHLSLEDLLHIRWNQARHRSKNKPWPFSITPDFLKDLFIAQEGRCFYSGLPLSLILQSNGRNQCSLSIDRVNPDLGYISENVVLCCDAVNTMKMCLSIKDFADLCAKVAAVHNSPEATESKLSALTHLRNPNRKQSP